MDVKKFFADLAAMYRKLTEQRPRGRLRASMQPMKSDYKRDTRPGTLRGTRPAMIRDIRRPKQRDANSATKRAMSVGRRLIPPWRFWCSVVQKSALLPFRYAAYGPGDRNEEQPAVHHCLVPLLHPR